MSESQQADQNEELEILLGCKQVTLATGEEVTVREYGGFLEGMRVDAIASPVIQDLHALFSEISDGGDFNLLELAAVFGAHEEVIARLIAMACDKPEDWVKSLNDEDGQLLLMAWWSTNQGFFLRRITRAHIAKRAATTLQAEKAGEASSPA